MIQLNLLPHTFEEQLAHEYKLLIAQRVALICAATAIAVSVMLFAGKFWLAAQRATISAAFTVPQKAATEQLVLEINTNIAQLASVQKDFVKWSGAYTDFLALIPADIAVNYLTIDASKETFSMNGRAPDRNALTLLKAQLDESALITDLNAPLANFLEQTDIDFQFTGGLDMQAYR